MRTIGNGTCKMFVRIVAIEIRNGKKMQIVSQGFTRRLANITRKVEIQGGVNSERGFPRKIDFLQV